MEELIVKTQEELDAVPVDYNGRIVIEFGTRLKPAILRKKYKYPAELRGSSRAVLRGSSSAELWESSSARQEQQLQYPDARELAYCIRSAKY